jgi:Tol biopolymer transport system component
VHTSNETRVRSLLPQSEGNSADPKFTPDGTKLLYRVVKQTPTEFRFMGGEPGELWVTELKSGRSESLAPGLESLDYDISANGRQVVLEARSGEGTPQLWVAGFDRQSPPRQIPNVTGRTPRFGPGGEIFFRNSGFAYRVQPDGTSRFLTVRSS